MDIRELQVKEKKEVESNGEMTYAEPVFVPAVDILEKKDILVLIADMPGVGTEGVEINLKRNELSISGRVGQRHEGMTSLYSEYKSGSYLRSFTLSNVIDQAKIEAVMKDGVLRIVLPKAETAKPRKITVHSA